MAYFIDERTLEEIKDRADIVSVISNYVDLKKVGSNYKGLCPFHGEKTPSFTVSPQKKIYKCFGCGEGGNVINFVMKIEGLSFPEASKKLGDEYGIDIKTKGNIDEGYQKTLEMMYQINREVAVYYMENLANHKPALDYLRNRGISLNTIKKFGLGYGKDSWDDVVKYLTRLNYDLDLAHKVGVIGKSEKGRYYDYFRNRVIFPIINPKSKVLGFGARALGDETPKYLNTSDSPIFFKGKNLYGLNYLNRSVKNDKIILVEGYIDVISLETNGINGAVASLGTAFTVDQANILRKYTDNLYISYDGDRAGREATKRALNILHSIDWDGNVIELPNGLDPDNFINEFGKFKYEVEIENSKSGYNFLIEDYKKTLDLKSIDGQVDLIKFIGKIIKKIKSPIERELQLKKLSDNFGISVESLKLEIFGNSNEVSINKIKRVNKEKRPLTNKEKTIIDILKLIMASRENYERFKDKLQLDMIRNQTLREVYSSIISTMESEGQVDKEVLLKYLMENYIINEGLYKELCKNIDEFSEVDKDDLVDDLIKRINSRDYKLNRKEIIIKIQELENKKNKSDIEKEELKELLNELISLNS